MAGDREELEALRRMAELEARPGVVPQSAIPQQMNPLQARMGIRGMRAGQGANDVVPKTLEALGNIGYNVGETVSDAASKVLPPEGAAALGYGANLATDIVPMAAGGAVGAASKVPEAMQGLGRKLMGSALKPGWKAWRSGKAESAINTMLEEGYNATKGGVESMRTKVSELGDQVSNIISTSGKELDKQALIARLKDVKDKYSKLVNPNEAIADIEKVGQEFAAHPSLPGNNVPIQLAQEMKQATGRELGGSAYGMGLKPKAERDAKKALVRALKEDISKAEPAVAPLNAKEGELLNAVKIAERRASMEGNNNPLGLALLAKNPEAAIGFLADKWGLTKSLAARLLYSQSEAVPASIGRAVGASMANPNGPTEQQIIAEQLRKQKPQRPAPQPMFSPEDASIPVAQR